MVICEGFCGMQRKGKGDFWEEDGLCANKKIYLMGPFCGRTQNRCLWLFIYAEYCSVCSPSARTFLCMWADDPPSRQWNCGLIVSDKCTTTTTTKEKKCMNYVTRTASPGHLGIGTLPNELFAGKTTCGRISCSEFIHSLLTRVVCINAIRIHY